MTTPTNLKAAKATFDAVQSLTPDMGLVWWHDLGFGYLAPGEGIYQYDTQYWMSYRARDLTPMADVLTRGRVDLVTLARAHLAAEVQTLPDATRPLRLLDIGIGGGKFLHAAANAGWDAYGFDVNPHARAYLQQHGRYGVPSDPRGWDAVAMWDVIEHIPDPRTGWALTAAKAVALSTPIYAGPEHARRSRHYKPGEHCWYFTDAGLRLFMDALGYDCIHADNRETEAGRDRIGSYLFLRRSR